MKTLASGLATMAAQPVTTWACGLRITRPDATIIGLTSHDVDVTISSVLYKAFPGLQASDLAMSGGLNVDNLELTTLHDGTVFTDADVRSRKWVNSKFLLFRYNWASPTDGIDSLIAGVFGDMQIRNGSVVAELFGLQFYLQQTVGPVSSKLCRNRLGVNDGVHSICNVAMGPFTASGTVTTATSDWAFTASALAQAADYFGAGEVRWLTGNNAGVTSIVKVHAAGGLFTIATPVQQPIQVGDTFNALAGCRKRLIEDCKTKFNMVLQFNGEPHRPLPNTLLKNVTPSAS